MVAVYPGILWLSVETWQCSSLVGWQTQPWCWTFIWCLSWPMLSGCLVQILPIFSAPSRSTSVFLISPSVSNRWVKKQKSAIAEKFLTQTYFKCMKPGEQFCCFYFPDIDYCQYSKTQHLGDMYKLAIGFADQAPEEVWLFRVALHIYWALHCELFTEPRRYTPNFKASSS